MGYVEFGVWGPVFGVWGPGLDVWVGCWVFELDVWGPMLAVSGPGLSVRRVLLLFWVRVSVVWCCRSACCGLLCWLCLCVVWCCCCEILNLLTLAYDLSLG